MNYRPVTINFIRELAANYPTFHLYKEFISFYAYSFISSSLASSSFSFCVLAKTQSKKA